MSFKFVVPSSQSSIFLDDWYLFFKLQSPDFPVGVINLKSRQWFHELKLDEYIYWNMRYSMKKIFAVGLFTYSSLAIFCQNNLRPVNELINKTEPGWDLVKNWIDSAKNKVEILLPDSAKAKDALYKTQVTTRSPMGAIIYSSGGILIEDGWIRILGSGNNKLNRTIPEWNKGKSFKEYGERPSFLLIADDAIGGFFAINGGQFGNDPGKVYYLSPGDLKWEPMGWTYSDFLDFCFNSDLNKFYKNLRWKNWKVDVAKLDGNEVYSFYPFLWTKEGKNINKDVRKIIPIEEQYDFNMVNRKKLGLEK